MSELKTVPFMMLGEPGAVVCEGDACVVPGVDARDAAEVEAQLSGLSARR